jgi:hypothetical protein
VRKCVDVAKPDGTACSVGPPCSGTATCQSGACRGPASADCDACNQCTFGVPPGAPDLCSSSPEGCFLCDRTVGCDGVADPGDRLLCQNLYACLIAPSHPGSNPSGSCVTSADSVECVCGPSRTCVGDDAAQAPCLVEALAAAKTTNPADILPAFNDVRLPILRAVLLAECQAHACAVECHF